MNLGRDPFAFASVRGNFNRDSCKRWRPDENHNTSGEGDDDVDRYYDQPPGPIWPSPNHLQRWRDAAHLPTAVSIEAQQPTYHHLRPPSSSHALPHTAAATPSSGTDWIALTFFNIRDVAAAAARHPLQAAAATSALPTTRGADHPLHHTILVSHLFSLLSAKEGMGWPYCQTQDHRQSITEDDVQSVVALSTHQSWRWHLITETLRAFGCSTSLPHSMLMFMNCCCSGRLRNLFESADGRVSLEQFRDGITKFGAGGARGWGDAVECMTNVIVASYREACTIPQFQSSPTTATTTTTTAYNDEEDSDSGLHPRESLAMSPVRPNPPSLVSGSGEQLFPKRTNNEEEIVVDQCSSSPTSPSSSNVLVGRLKAVVALHRFAFELLAATECDFKFVLSHAQQWPSFSPPLSMSSSSSPSPSRSMVVGSNAAAHYTTTPMMTTTADGDYSMGYRGVTMSGAVRVLQLTLGSCSPIIAHVAEFFQEWDVRDQQERAAQVWLQQQRHQAHLQQDEMMLCETTSAATMMRSHPAAPSMNRCRTLSKDLWNMLLVFSTCRGSGYDFPRYSGYREEECWPRMIDEFVLWARARSV